jgi:alanine racemase
MSALTDRSWVEISSTALKHNLSTIRRNVPKRTGILAVVKANAYGHGVEWIARQSTLNGVSWFGVANVVEALELRQFRRREPIILLSAVLPAEMPEAVRNDFVIAISSLEEAQRLARVARKLHRKARVHFAVDIGMGRLGMWHEEAVAHLTAISLLDDLHLEGIFTHFPCADDDPPMTRHQWRDFDRVCSEFPQLLVHAANSPALLSKNPLLKNSKLVRAGIALYGAGPTRASEKLLRPLLTWKSRITHIDHVPAGRTISYGSTYRLKRPETHAIVSVGYADGYHRLLSNKADVLINGKRCPIRGRVTMDQIIVDASHAGPIQIGDEVVLIGKQGREEITANELATLAQTISYEIFTSIGKRVTRYYQ